MKFYCLVLIPVAAMMFANLQGFGQARPKPTHKTKLLPGDDKLTANDLIPVDPLVVIGRLPNGLTYYIRKNTEPKNRAELYLVNKVGSVLETDEQQGLAHFTEHMAFNGTKDFPKNELVSYLQKSGVKFGADLNAYTGFDETVFQLPLPTDSVTLFEKGFDILANWAGMVSFDTEQIDGERGVVLEEERLRGKNADERMSKMTLPVIFNHSRYALRMPIGKEQILKSFKPETIKSFYHDWYRPDLQAVIAVGDFDPKRVENLIKQKFSGLKNPGNQKPRTKYLIPNNPGTVVKMVTDKEQPYTIAQIIVKHPGNIIKTQVDYLQSIRTDLFNHMLNARISELTQKADPPFLYASAYYGDFIGNLSSFTSTAYAKPNELKKAIKAIAAETERARKFGFTQTELDRAKLSIMTNVESAWSEQDKTSSVNYVQDYQQNFLHGDAIPGVYFELKFHQLYLGKITLVQINALAGKFISEQDRDVIIQAPENEKNKLPTQAVLLSWINSASTGLTPYIDNVSTQPLLKDPPQGTKVVAEQKNALLKTTTLKLANGVTIILKPTDFKNDHIVINGFSLGGTSLAVDNDYVSASLADDFVGGSGIANIDQIRLTKMLTGKNISVSPYIGETTQGIQGSFAPADMETALQLIYLYYTQPRKDNDIWKATITQYKASLANRGLDPESVYEDTVSAVLNSHNIRRTTLTESLLKTADQDKAFAFYKDRFADASGATFTIVGSFDAEEIKPLLEKYLGALPAINRKETYKDVNVYPPTGQLTKTVYKGIADKSNVRLVFTGGYVYSEANNIQMDALEEILQIKLTERLREKESSVYAPNVDISYSKLPAPRYTVTINFGCAPANTDKLIAATLEEINKIKQNGAEQTDIEKFCAEDKRSTEVQLKQNEFWLEYLSEAVRNQDDPHAILVRNKALALVTPQTTKATANQYLSGANLIKLILMPKKK